MNLRDKIAAGRAALRGGVVPVVAEDLFPTPPDVAARVAAYAELAPGLSVLEPSAGTGALVRAVRAAEPDVRRIIAIERDARLADQMGHLCFDFLEVPPTHSGYDRVMMNPPFSGGADIRHVEHALEFLRPGGLLVAIMADGPRQAAWLAAVGAEDLERLPAGTFAGTQVRARIVRIRT